MTADLILVVDDEQSIVDLARLYLERDGYQVHSVGDGLEAIQAVKTLKPNLVVLDVMLPGADGFEVCRRLRAERNNVPIIIVTARDEDIDKILGLELGADDYLAKPFNPRELVARVRAILRRTEPRVAESTELIRAGDLLIDAARHEVSCNGVQIELRTQEFEVLLVLARQKGKVLTREQLLNQAWGYEFYGQTRTVDVHVVHLRRALQASSVHIDTITGIGYKLVG